MSKRIRITPEQVRSVAAQFRQASEQSHMTRFVSLLAEINTSMNGIADRFQAADEA